jgi:SAM-dependent methyltransferase
VRPVPPTGHWHDDYERGRPGWPPAAAEVAGVPPSATVLELGAGTGKLTRILVTRFHRVIAVEPDEEMRRLLVSRYADADVRVGSAEAIPVGDSSVDAVFAAEAFHWFDGERALAEIARVLRPRGAVVMMWNVPAGPTEPSIAPVEQLLTEHAPPRDELGHDPVDLNTARFSSGRGARRSRALRSASSRRHGSRIRSCSTATRSSPSSSRWAGSASCPTRAGCPCSTG